MNIYYTAKDIEELAAKGVKQLEVGPNVFLTDFAYETAEQLEIDLVQPGEQMQVPQPVVAAPQQLVSQGRYHKPKGCQHGSSPAPKAISQTATGPTQPQNNSGSTSVNRLVDMMGKIIKRGDSDENS